MIYEWDWWLSRKRYEFWNFLQDNNHKHPHDTLTKLYLENEWRKDYQRHLENKIIKLMRENTSIREKRGVVRMKNIDEKFYEDCTEPQNLRYAPSADDFTVFDLKTGEKLKGVEIIVRLNRQNSLLRACNKHRDALIKSLNEEKDKADGELRKALIRICNKELDI